MVSEYGYITVAELENYAGLDYSTDKSSTYTDAVIEAVISQAERMVNAYTGQSYSGTISDAVKYASMDVAFKTMHNRIISDGIFDRDNPPKRYDVLLTDEMKAILSKTEAFYALSYTRSDE